MALYRGDVILVPFPFSDLSATKVRPAIVVSGAAYHSNEPYLILAAVTSKIAAATGPMDYVLADWQLSGLRTQSALKTVLFTLDPTRVILKIGTLSSTDMDEVDQRLRLALEL